MPTAGPTLAALSNERIDCTFVNGTRVIYNMQGRWAGSPYIRILTRPTVICAITNGTFNDDDMFWARRISTRFISRAIVRATTPVSNENSWPTPSFVRWACRGSTSRYVAVYVNGNRRGTLMEDTQLPGSDVVKEHFPNDDDGFLYKMQPWFEMAPLPSGDSMAFKTTPGAISCHTPRPAA
jgi:hypothetical protein